MSVFINPSALPGGRDWTASCAAASALGNATTANVLSESLGCLESPTGGLIQVLLLLCTYGFILYTASSLISDGSELLLLVPSLRDVVGSIVLPVLGAIPDGCIVFFSGLGPNAQEEISVGVGALAGSTCMLLTVPWCLAIIAGRVNILPGEHANYKPLRRGDHFDKLYPKGNMNLTKTGVAPRGIVSQNGKIMLYTTLPFVIIQATAFLVGDFMTANASPESTRAAARLEKIPAAFCFLVAMLSCAAYLYYQASSPSAAENLELKTSSVERKKRKDGTVSVAISFARFWDVASKATEHDPTESTPLAGSQVEHARNKFMEILEEAFSHYDDNNNYRISIFELSLLMNDLGYRLSGDEMKELLSSMAKDGHEEIAREDFLHGMEEFVRSDLQSKRHRGEPIVSTSLVADEANVGGEADVDADVEELEDVPHGLQDEDPDTQVRKVLQRSLIMMSVGTALVLVFSDPMVGVLSDVGARIGVSPFYISFILAPLASNASELLAAYQYALKKTSKTVTISLSTLLGAAILNNTFVLAIFMALIYLKGLAWKFAAETIAIVVVEVLVFTISQKPVMYVKDAFLVLSLFPLALFIVAFLENVVGLD